MDSPTQEEIQDRLKILNRAHENAAMATTAQAGKATQRAKNDALKWFADRGLKLCIESGINAARYVIAPPLEPK